MVLPVKSLTVIGAIVLTGCTTTSKMNVEDLNHFRVDCSRKYEQLAFLESQMPSQRDRLVNGLRTTSPVGVVATMLDGTYHEEQAMFNDRQKNIARHLIYQIKSHCPDLPQPQGCLHVNETFPSGSSQGAQCYQKSQARPVVNRWNVVD